MIVTSMTFLVPNAYGVHARTSRGPLMLCLKRTAAGAEVYHKMPQRPDVQNRARRAGADAPSVYRHGYGFDDWTRCYGELAAQLSDERRGIILMAPTRRRSRRCRRRASPARGR